MTAIYGRWDVSRYLDARGSFLKAGGSSARSLTAGDEMWLELEVPMQRSLRWLRGAIGSDATEQLLLLMKSMPDPRDLVVPFTEKTRDTLREYGLPKDLGVTACEAVGDWLHGKRHGLIRGLIQRQEGDLDDAELRAWAELIVAEIDALVRLASRVPPRPTVEQLKAQMQVLRNIAKS